MLQKITLCSVALFGLNTAFTQDSSDTTSLAITGFADVYYKYDFARTKANNLTSFTSSHNSFEPGMASVKFDYKTSKVQLVGDFGIGKRAQEFSYNDEGVLSAIKQLYISYLPASWIKLTAGTWATHVGYELVDANLNRNYSMSYMFTSGPFFHTGVKMEATYGSSGFMIGLTNPTDFKYVPEGYTNNKFFIAQYSFAPTDIFKAYFNYVGGEGTDTTKSKQFDLVLTSKISDKVSIGYNGTLARVKSYLGNKLYDDEKSWWGSALYLNVDPTNSFGLTLRSEYFSDKNSLKMFGSQPEGGSIWASTLSANLKVDKLIFIPEFRVDQASKTLFINQDGDPVKTSANILFAAIYQF